MKKFEYITIGHEPDMNELNNLGKDRWELCDVRESTTTSSLSNYAIETQLWFFKREISDIDYARLLILCSYKRNVPNLQHRTISEFAQFVEDVMSNKPEYEKYRTFDINSTDAIEYWIKQFHEYCEDEYGNIQEELLENELETLRNIEKGNEKSGNK